MAGVPKVRKGTGNVWTAISLVCFDIFCLLSRAGSNIVKIGSLVKY